MHWQREQRLPCPALAFAGKAERAEHNRGNHHRDPDECRQKRPVGPRIGIIKPLDDQARAAVLDLRPGRQPLPIDGLYSGDGSASQPGVAGIDNNPQRNDRSHRVGERAQHGYFNPDKCPAASHARRCATRRQSLGNNIETRLRPQRFCRRVARLRCRGSDCDTHMGGGGADRKAEQRDLQSGHDQQQRQRHARTKQPQHFDARDRDNTSSAGHRTNARFRTAASRLSAPSSAMNPAGVIAGWAMPL